MQLFLRCFLLCSVHFADDVSVDMLTDDHCDEQDFCISSHRIRDTICISEDSLTGGKIPCQSKGWLLN